MRVKGRKLPDVLLRLTERALMDPLSTWWARLYFRLWEAKVGNKLWVSGTLRLRLYGSLRIGNHARIHSGYSNFVGAAERTAIWISRNGILNIGDHCGLSNTTIICRERIDILDETFIGGGCRIYDSDFHQLAPEARIRNCGPIASAAVRIGPRAFIGSHCILLKGVSIGEAAVIGAGSLVTKSVPAWELWGGVPAHFIRKVAKAEASPP